MSLITFFLGCLTIIETLNLLIRITKIIPYKEPPIDPYIQKYLYS